MAGTTGKKARGRDVASKVRLAFEKALSNLADKDKSPSVIELSDILQECLIAEPLKTLDTVAKFVPREMMIEQETTVKFISGQPLDVDAWEKENLSGPEIHTEH